MFTQEFRAGLSKNPVKTSVALCEKLFNEFTHLSDEPDVDEFIRFEKGRDFIFHYLKENNLDTRYLTGSIGIFSSITEKIFKLHRQISETHHYLEDILIHEYPDPELLLKRDFETGILQILNSGQKKSLQEHTNKLNELIPQIISPDNGQQDRLLYKLKKLQQELLKKKTNLDKFWSFIGEAFQSIEISGKDTGPFAETLNIITKIIREAQS